MKTLAIICVDDEAVVLDSLKEQLRRNLPKNESCLIEVADTGEEALEIIEELQEDDIDVALVISDQIMPGMKGDALLVKIHDSYPAILQILLTGQASADAVGNAVNKANLYRYITKPWDELDLALTVTEALRRHQQEIQLAEQNKVLREMNRALGNLNATLEEKVEERTQALKQANVQLKEAKTAAEAANQAKSTFLANMNHELRTPLNAILGFSQILSQEPSLKPNQQKHLSIINRSGEHLLNLINDVLEMSKIEAGKMMLNLDQINLHDLLSDLQAMMGLKAEAADIQLIFNQAPDLPTYVKADPSKLRQVLINLLGNAVKFTQTGRVTLNVSSHTCATAFDGSSPNIFRFEVEDTGPGIASEEIGQIFEAFTQTETGRRSQKGTGLGLAISHKLVQLMGGMLQVNSQVGLGTCFWFEIALDLAQPEIVPRPNRQVLELAPGQPAYRVLVVDDIVELRLLLNQMLSQVGFEVREAEHGKAAIALWQTWQPQLILLDWQMPVMDGATTVRQIRHLANGKAPKIIGISASLFDESRHAAIAASCDDVLLKPFTAATLFEAIARHLPVSYRYAEPLDVLPETVATSVSKTLSQEDLRNTLQTTMPSHWLTDLHRAASVLNAEEGLALMNQLPAEPAEVRKVLTEYIHEFRFDILIELLEPFST